METAVAIHDPQVAALAEQVVIKGDLAGLSEQDRMSYYTAVCQSLGLNPLTRPFEYINLNGKLTLYATRAAADQLRAIKGITITSLDPRQVGDLFVVVATGRDRSGREDSSTGAVATVGLRGEALANAMMKAETKAKRRLTLSLAGLGMTDETEVDSIPGGVREDVPHLTLAERAAAARAAIPPSTQEASGEAPHEAQASHGPAGADEGRLSAPPLTKAQFAGRLSASPIDRNHAATVRLVMFPDATVELTDVERGELWAALEAEQASAA